MSLRRVVQDGLGKQVIINWKPTTPLFEIRCSDYFEMYLLVYIIFAGCDDFFGFLS